MGADEARRPGENRGIRRRRWLLIAAITVIAGALRLWGIHFGLPQIFTRPDEEAVASVTGRILRSGANPAFFRYPTLFMYSMALVHRVRFDGATADEASIYAAARIVSALVGTATVPLLFVAARRLFSTSAALIAAALLAVAFLHVRDSHFGVTDVPATFMVIAACTAIVTLLSDIRQAPLARSPSLGVVIAGLLCGLAASTKYNAGLILLALIVAVPNARLLALGVAAAALGFLAGTPYALLARRQFLADVLAERAHLVGGHGIRAGIGLVDHFVFSLRFGLGVWFLAAAVAGAIWLVVQDRRRAPVILAFPVTYYVAMGTGRTVFVRYMTPLVPFAALLAGFAIDRCAVFLAAWLRSRRSEASAPGAPGLLPQAVIAVGIAALVGADSLVRSVALDRLLAEPDSRVIAADFVRARYPVGASVYQTGAGYGHVMLTPENAYPEWPLAFAPRLVLVQRSWLPAYSDIPPTLVSDLARIGYRLVERVEVENRTSRVVPVFDQQDAFFVPLAGFERFIRPGPAIEIYERP